MELSAAESAGVRGPLSMGKTGWNRLGLSFEKAAAVLIRKMNEKYYDLEGDNEFTWSRWFFPVLTTDRGLKVLDSYLLEYVRYLYSGRHYKGNYRISYDGIKKLGYHSLVYEYYRYRDEKKASFIRL